MEQVKVINDVDNEWKLLHCSLLSNRNSSHNVFFFMQASIQALPGFSHDHKRHT